MVFGKATWGPALNLTALSAADGFVVSGVASGDMIMSGNSVSGAGDVDGDGFDDVLVGAPRGVSGGDEFGFCAWCLGSDVVDVLVEHVGVWVWRRVRSVGGV